MKNSNNTSHPSYTIYPDILSISLENEKELKLVLIELNPYIQITSVTRKISFDTFNFINEELSELLNYSTKKIHSGLKKLGSFMYAIILESNSENLRNIFNKKSNLIFFIDDKSKNKLNRIPLELIYDKIKSKFLSLTRPTSRLIQSSNAYKTSHLQWVKKTTMHTKTSLLIIVDPLDNLKYSYKEGVEIYFFLKQNFDYFFLKLDFLSKKINEIDFIHYLKTYHWIYYSGHGEYFIEITSRSSLMINNSFNDTKYLSSNYNYNCNFIFINSCNIGNSIFMSNSIIQYMLNSGKLSIITSSMKILDNPGFINCIKRFYKNIILNQDSFEKALFKIRKYNYYRQKQYNWIYFSFYGHSFK